MGKTLGKIICTGLLLCSAYAGISTACVSAAEPPQIRVFVDGEAVQFDSLPIIENGRTLVPMRAILEALGMEVTWLHAERSVIAVGGDIKSPSWFKITVDSEEMQAEGQIIHLDTPARLINGRTFVPLRAVSEVTGAEVVWSEGERNVSIVSAKRKGEAATAPKDTVDASKNSGVINIVDVSAKDLQAPAYGERDEAEVSAAKGANDFAFQLSAALAKEVGNDNFVCSPYSVWIPLAALVNATDASHKDALLTALNAAGISEGDINNAASRMLYDLTKQDVKEFAKEYAEELGGVEYYHNPLKIANAVFVGNNVTLKKSFAQTFMDYYRGSAINVDFSSSEAARAVNNWASENTEGLITDIIDKFDPNTVAAIANAIYFSDRWQWEFDPERTTESIFHSPADAAGDKNAFFMLRQGDSQTYYEDETVQAMPLRFKTGGGLYIILPKDGNATELLSSMTSEYFDEIQHDSIQATGKLLLPRFSIESGVIQLKDTLEALGVPLFDSSAAALTGGLVEEDIPVWLSGAMHKAYINVDEKGTTAAAVTIMLAGGAGMPIPTAPFEMNCNKPFVFVLYGDSYGGGNQVLFTGIVNQP